MEIVTGHYAERIHLDIVELATQDIYLEMPWLKKHNPVIFIFIFFYFYLILTLVVALQPCRSSS